MAFAFALASAVAVFGRHTIVRALADNVHSNAFDAFVVGNDLDTFSNDKGCRAHVQCPFRGFPDPGT